MPTSSSFLSREWNYRSSNHSCDRSMTALSTWPTIICFITYRSKASKLFVIISRLWHSLYACDIAKTDICIDELTNYLLNLFHIFKNWKVLVLVNWDVIPTIGDISGGARISCCMMQVAENVHITDNCKWYISYCFHGFEKENSKYIHSISITECIGLSFNNGSIAIKRNVIWFRSI